MSYTIHIDENDFNIWYKENYGESFDYDHTINADMVLTAYIARRTIQRWYRAEETIADMRITQSALVNGLEEYNDKVDGLKDDFSEEFIYEYKQAEKLIRAANQPQ